jgi:hypothetical protein
MRYGHRFGLLGALTCALLSSPALAADPVALVEDVAGAPAGVEFMDYLSAGKVIRLGAKDGLVVDYFHSCIRETITGGTITIGAAQSSVAGGTVSRQKVECDGGKLRLTTEQAAKSGVVVFRAPAKPRNLNAEASVERTLYGLSPLIDLRGGGKLLLERLDQPGERLEIDVPANQLVRGTFYDCAKHGQSLARGGIYRATADGRSVVFKVDPMAQPGASPLAGRLLRL